MQGGRSYAEIVGCGNACLVVKKYGDMNEKS